MRLWKWVMSRANPFEILKKNSIWEKTPSPIWVASSFFLHRNLASNLFPPKLSKSESLQVLSSLEKTLLSSSNLKNPTFFRMENLKSEEKEFILEHFLAPLDTQNPECQSGIVIDQTGNFLGIINGEDHLSLQYIDSNSNWKDAWKTLTHIESEIAKHHPFAYSNQFGYLTSILSNSGTALTVQAFLHLPSLIQLGQMDQVLMKEVDDQVIISGLTGTDQFIGDIVIIQNRYTIGLTEDHILEETHHTATQLAHTEKLLREEMIENRDRARNIGFRKSNSKSLVVEPCGLCNYSIKLGLQRLSDICTSQKSIFQQTLDYHWVSGRLRARNATRIRAWRQ